ncbi:MAG: putative beta-D-galactosidase [Candidatus Jettenia ecosi]|uniref:Putative beta-D-galactosidase n=1 Tax=Candidatus Jettenia ecosi TaxID=2494326 RepID=A0A533Q7I9_9BACT|nr:MAG: putative beta-D-galactosidase [Candidatus Jettenia ecosi]
MIIDRLGNWETYFSGAAWKCVFDFLTSLKPDVEEKEYTLQGTDILARIMSYETRLPNIAMLEAHQKYIDIQTVLIGAEGIEWFPIDALQIKIPYNMEKDVEFYHRPRMCPARVDACPGTFVVLFPKDAHIPQLVVGDSTKLVKKAVVKVNGALVKP